jgi:hypothetical protein
MSTYNYDDSSVSDEREPVFAFLSAIIFAIIIANLVLMVPTAKTVSIFLKHTFSGENQRSKNHKLE